MAHIDQTKFEELWQGVKDRPQVRRAIAAPIQADFSLTGILNHYLTMAASQREWGKISQQDYNDLETAVNTLKMVLARINDSGLVAEAVTRNAALIQQKIVSKPSV